MSDPLETARLLVRSAGFTLRKVPCGSARAVVDHSIRIMEYGPRATALDLLEAAAPHAELPRGWRKHVEAAMRQTRALAST